MFTVTAVLSLALAVGVNAAVFTVVNALWLRPTLVSDPARLTVVYRDAGQGASTFLSERVSYGESRCLNDIAGLSGIALELIPDGISGEFRPRLSIGDAALRVTAVSHNYFDVVGVGLRGRTFTGDDDLPGARPVAVISDRLWQREFRRESGVIGREISIGDRHLVVVGVAPRGFGGVLLGESADLWIPLAAVPRFAPFGRDDAMVIAPVRAYARLRSSASSAAVESRATQLLHRPVQLRTVAEFPYPLGSQAAMTRDRRLVALLSATVALVLVIGCVNLTTLLLARAEERRHEVAIRLALGIAPYKIVRLLLIEAGLIGCCGSLVALAVSIAFVSGLSRVALPSGMVIGDLDLSVDWRVAGFAAAAGLSTCLAAALGPAWRASSTALSTLLSRSSGCEGRPTTGRSTLLAGHIALSITLLIVASLLNRSVHRAMTMDLAFDADRTIGVLIQPAISQYADEQGNFNEAQRQRDVGTAIERIRSMPGVLAATLGSLPLRESRSSSSGWALATGGTTYKLDISVERVGPGYLSATGIRCREGRDFRDGDVRHGAPRVVLVSEDLARRLWHGRTPIGERLSIGGWADAEVVGVASEAVRLGIRSDYRSAVYLPEDLAEGSPRFMFDFVVRTAAPSSALTRNLRDLLHRSFPSATQIVVRSGRDEVARQIVSERLGASVFAYFSAAALALCLLGTYGLVSYVTARRMRHNAVRMALGAMPSQLLRHIVAESLVPVFLGSGVGIVMAVAASSLIRGYVFGISALDPVSFLGAPLLLLLVTSGASLVGARRLRHLDASAALRTE